MAPVGFELRFNRGSRCRIFIRRGLIETLSHNAEFSGASSIAIVTDETVRKLYASALAEKLEKVAQVYLVAIPPGEKSKTLETVSDVCSQFNSHGLDRKSIIVSLGGGVVGDLAGFAASIFKRGVRLCHVPTTLLAQVDSSIGGKNGVDVPWGKNQLGTFYEPSAIFIDPDTLDSLPGRELINGISEMVKSGIIADRRLFKGISKVFRDERSKDGAICTAKDLKHLIQPTCKVKMEIVQKDELEANLRSILNYGHTVGHAIEASSNYNLSHGRAVLLGMLCEGWISQELGIFEQKDYDEEKEVLLKIAEAYDVRLEHTDRNKVFSFALSDKKSTGGNLRMSLPERIGRMHQSAEGKYTVPVSRELFENSLDETCW